MQGCICKLQADDAVERLMKSVAQEVGLGLFENALGEIRTARHRTSHVSALSITL